MHRRTFFRVLAALFVASKIAKNTPEDANMRLLKGHPPSRPTASDFHARNAHSPG
jgi:hypothetical protein